MNKKLLIPLIAILIALVFPIPMQADIGPKPSTSVEFSGLEGQTYYVTLLADVSVLASHSVYDPTRSEEPFYNENIEEKEIFMKFVNYQDVDGYYFLQYYENCTDTGTFTWGYFAPDNFKILIYLPETDRFIVSDEIYEKYAFDSYFSVTVNGDKMTVEKSYLKNAGGELALEIITLVIRIILTIAIEVAIALLFVFRNKKVIKTILLVNIITQILLNVSVNLFYDNFGGQFGTVVLFIVLEMAIFILEATIYTLYMGIKKEYNIPLWKPPVYALAANIASFVVGLILAFFVPGLF